MLEAEKVKAFWESRSKTYSTVAFESIANLEQDPNNLEIKIRDETAKVFSWLPDLAGKTVLDLGAGVGQWTFRFAERGARNITAVEYASGLASIGEKESQRRGIQNIEFVVCPAEQFVSNAQFDIIFISGLFVYLNDDQAEQLLRNLAHVANQDSVILLRDGAGVVGRHEINNRFSAHLQTNYSATYRTADEYVAIFNSAGFECLQQENMFPEGHPLNKYPETRLRLLSFRKR